VIGDRCPADFLELSPFTGHRAALEQRGIHSAAELREEKPKLLASELGITVDVVDRWLKVAHLYTWLREVPPTSAQAEGAAKRDSTTTALVFLLMKANLDSRKALLRELQQEPVNECRQFRARLIDCARPWAVAVPGKKVILSWRRSLERPSAANGQSAEPIELTELAEPTPDQLTGLPVS
jgi:hypothetical protein